MCLLNRSSSTAHETGLYTHRCFQTSSEAFIRPAIGLAAPVHNQTPKSHRGMLNKQLSSLDELAHGQTRVQPAHPAKL
ncbi:hypothetical protein HYQ45_013000 [Verticillium longisporum]|uniref:Uncharacterized protein n=1 Tax=Verticillium longisporum TaxID=100787 RepID=A0A8I2ZBE7_VERLO|nr:hypothetical protein HYQ45_013000 [Verticillium longisporum]